MMRILLSLTFFLLSTFSTYAQIDDPFVGVRSPSTIPVSPEAFSISKYGDLPVGHFTGTAQFQVPLFSLANSGIGIDVKLNYSTNGIKVDEVASRVGMGWNLQAGGVITRKVLGLPDGHPGSLLNQPTTNDVYSTAFYSYLVNSEGPSADNDLDEYSYNFMGYSGSFLIKNGVIKQFERSALIVDRKYINNRWIYIITTPDGVKYYFGEDFAYDESESYNPYLTDTERYQHKLTTTAWYLSKVVNPNKSDSIVLSYERFGGTTRIDYFTGVTQDYIRFPYPQGVAEAANFIDMSPTGMFSCNEPTYIKEVFSKCKLYPCFLKQIVSSTGKISFSYSAREDLPLDRKIDTISIFATDSVRPQKRYLLSHTYSIASDIRYYTRRIPSVYLQDEFPDLKKRLFLQGVTELGKADSATGAYRFYYDSINQLPPRLSFSQDFEGFFNRKENGIYFFSKHRTDMFNPGNFGADRSFDETGMKKGVLTKIVYPTGGESNITYEPNKSFSHGYNRITHKDTSVNLSLINSSINNKRVSIPFSATPNMNFTLNAECIWLGNPADSMTIRGDENIFITIMKLSDSSTYLFRPLEMGNTYASNLGHDLNGDYELIIHTNYVKLTGHVTLNVKQYFPLPPADEACGGLRIYSLVDKENNRFAKGRQFSYGLFEDSTVSSESLGNINFIVDNHIHIGRKLGYLHSPEETNPSIGYCYYNVYSSGGWGNLYFSDYSTSGYKNVIEYTIDSSGARVGGVEYEFLVDRKSRAQPLSFEFPNTVEWYAPTVIVGTALTNDDFFNGKQLYQAKFTLDNGVKKMQEKKMDFYSVDTAQHAIDTFYIVRKALARENPAINLKYRFDYDINKYYRHYYWPHLDSTTTTTYSAETSDSTVVKESYSYRNGVNYLPTEKMIRYAPGHIVAEKYYYPNDSLTNPVYSAMVNQNKVNEVVLKQVYKNATLLLEEHTDYGVVNGDAQLIVPVQKRVRKNGELLYSKLDFTGYDLKGNLLSFSANDNSNNRFILNKTGDRIAVCVNVVQNDIFFDSFEESTWFGAIRDSSRSHSGNRSARLDKPTPGELTLPRVKWLNVVNASEKKYKFSGWVYSNGPVAKIALLMKRTGETNEYTSIDMVSTSVTGGWVYLEKDVPVAADITGLNLRLDNGGGGTVWFDDVRLHPSDAQMTTYTYKPLVGITSMTDINNQTTHYEYDEFSRLIRLRDADGRIMKQWKYQYGDSAFSTSCSGQAGWQYTGVYRCVTDTSNATNGQWERQMQDVNPCSITYNQTQWVLSGTNLQACPLCSGIDKKVINGVCETGVKVCGANFSQNGKSHHYYHYKWSDNSISPTYIGLGKCSVLIPN